MSIIKDLFKSPSSNIPDTGEIVNLAIGDTQRANPDIFNPWGSHQVTFDENGRPTINQTMAPDMQQLRDMQMGYLLQGPPQLNMGMDPGLLQSFNHFANRAGVGGMGNALQFDKGRSQKAPYGFDGPRYGAS